MADDLDRLLERLSHRRATETAEPSVRQAAVAILLAPDPDQVLIIRRSERANDPWSGHLAFPGGRRDPGDPDLLATALRETWEETALSVDPSMLRLVLSDLAPRNQTIPPIMVRPYVFRMDAPHQPRPNAEVAHAAWIPLARFAADGVRRTLAVQSRGVQFDAEGYDLDEGFLWGMTERIINPIISHWKELRIAKS